MDPTGNTGRRVPATDGILRVIEKGLRENDRIVISGMSRAREGSVVQPLEEFDVSPTTQEVVQP